MRASRTHLRAAAALAEGSPRPGVVISLPLAERAEERPTLRQQVGDAWRSWRLRHGPVFSAVQLMMWGPMRLLDMGESFVLAHVRGFVRPETREARLAACEACPRRIWRSGWRCRLRRCSCPETRLWPFSRLGWLTWLVSAECPRGLWPAVVVEDGPVGSREVSPV